LFEAKVEGFSEKSKPPPYPQVTHSLHAGSDLIPSYSQSLHKVGAASFTGVKKKKLYWSAERPI
jgi:hypothetical protein